MRINPVILAATMLVGIFGIVFGVRAFTTYDDASEAFTRVELQYIPDSFKWQDPEYDQAVASFRVVNGSSFRADVEGFSVSLRFDGEFAGTDYDIWPGLIVPGNESREFQMQFSVTTNSIQDQGGTADLSFTGQMLVRFEEFEQPLSFRFRGGMGKVPYDGS
ncbi:MAG: hypothetical protein R3A46_11885 [Thermomicrobiales bacterium]